MNDSLGQSGDFLEAQLNDLLPSVDAGGLREATLRQVRRELRAARRERRFARMTAFLLVVGIALNAATLNRQPTLPTGGQIASRPTTESIARLVVAFAEATDLETANIFARQLAAFNGFPADSPQASAIEREINRRLLATPSRGKDG